MFRGFLVNKPDWMGELGETSFVHDCFPSSDAGSVFSYSVYISSLISGTGCCVYFSSGCEISPMVLYSHWEGMVGGRVHSGMMGIAARLHDSAFCLKKVVAKKPLLPIPAQLLPCSLGSAVWNMLIPHAEFQRAKKLSCCCFPPPCPTGSSRMLSRAPGSAPFFLASCLAHQNSQSSDARCTNLRCACVRVGCYLPRCHSF